MSARRLCRPESLCGQRLKRSAGGGPVWISANHLRAEMAQQPRAIQRFPLEMDHLVTHLSTGSAVGSLLAHVLDRRTGPTSPGHALQRFPLVVDHFVIRRSTGSAVDSLLAHVLDRRTGPTSPGHALDSLLAHVLDRRTGPTSPGHALGGGRKRSDFDDAQPCERQPCPPDRPRRVRAACVCQPRWRLLRLNSME